MASTVSYASSSRYGRRVRWVCLRSQGQPSGARSRALMAAMPCGLARLSIGASGGTSQSSAARARLVEGLEGDGRIVGEAPQLMRRRVEGGEHGARPAAGMAPRQRAVGDPAAAQDEQRERGVEGDGRQPVARRRPGCRRRDRGRRGPAARRCRARGPRSSVRRRGGGGRTADRSRSRRRRARPRPASARSRWHGSRRADPPRSPGSRWSRGAGR